MDLIEKYLGEATGMSKRTGRNMSGLSMSNWKKSIVHNNPYVGRYFNEPILYFNVFDPSSNVDKIYVWTGKKWMPMDNVDDPNKYTYDQKDAAMELIRKAVPNLKQRIKRQNPEWEDYMKGW